MTASTDATAPRARIAVWIVLPVAVTMVLFLVLLATREPSSHRVSQSHLVGGIGPAIVGETITGDTFDLDLERGRWVVVNFFSTTCVPCIVEHPELVKFQNAHSEAGDATVVSIAFDDSADNVREFFREYGGGWPVLVEGTGTFAVSYGVAQVPESYLIAPSGLVVDKLIGGIVQDDLESRITALQVAAENRSDSDSETEGS